MYTTKIVINYAVGLSKSVTFLNSLLLLVNREFRPLQILRFYCIHFEMGIHHIINEVIMLLLFTNAIHSSSENKKISLSIS